eukprot:3903508-Pyramimonas_sp.AAC.1
MCIRDSWTKDCNEEITNDKMLYGTSELFQHPVYVGLTKYADDIRKLILSGKQADALSLVGQAHKIDDTLNVRLTEIGLKQNQDNQETI